MEIKKFFVRWSWVLLCLMFLITEALFTMVVWDTKQGFYHLYLAFGITGALSWLYNLVREVRMTVNNKMKDRHDMELY